jgi:hypothetical protein
VSEPDGTQPPDEQSRPTSPSDNIGEPATGPIVIPGETSLDRTRPIGEIVRQPVVVDAHVITPPRSRRTSLVTGLLITIVILILAVATMAILLVRAHETTTDADASAPPTTGQSASTEPSPSSEPPSLTVDEPSEIPSAPASQAQTPAPSTAPSAAGSAAPAQATGTQLGAYEIQLTLDYAVPLGPTKPTQSQFNQSNMGDLLLNNFAGSISFDPLNGNTMVKLDPGAMPTYDLCTSTTLFEGSAPPATRTSFCLIGPGVVIGVYVKSVSTSNAIAYVNYAVLDVTVWQA